jgi:DNA-binding GntR family transcriptional regulator
MGEPLNLTQLEKELGISNTPIREAISALVSEGLLVSFHNSRVHVVTFKDKDIKDLMDVGRLITQSAFELVLENDHTEELIGMLEERLTEQRQIIIRDDDYYEYVKAVDYFNRAFIEASHNIRMNTIYDRMSNLLFLCRLQYYTTGTNTVERNLKEHEGIIEAVRRKDPAMLREQLITHYDIRKMHDRI